MIESITKIVSLDDKDLAPYRTLRRPLEHRRSGIFIAEGEKVVRRLLQSKISMVSMLLTPEWLQQYHEMVVARPESIRIFVGEKVLLESIVGFELHQGSMALGNVPESPSLNELLQRNPRPWALVALDGIVSAENMGVIVRNASANGIQGLIVGETCADPYLRRAVRNSMGTIFDLAVHYSSSLVQTLQDLRTHQAVGVIAAHPREGSRSLSTIDMKSDCCIVLGNEGEGISAPVLQCCDIFAEIPMKKNVDSMNVGSASAVFFYETMRQRRSIP